MPFLPPPNSVKALKAPTIIVNSDVFISDIVKSMLLRLAASKVNSTITDELRFAVLPNIWRIGSTLVPDQLILKPVNQKFFRLTRF